MDFKTQFAYANKSEEQRMIEVKVVEDLFNFLDKEREIYNELSYNE